MENGVPDPVRRDEQFESVLQAANKLLERIRPEREHAGNITAKELEQLRLSLNELSKRSSLETFRSSDRPEAFSALLETVAQISRLLPPFHLRLLRERDRLVSEQVRLAKKKAWAAGNQRTL